ncbi:flagellar hook-associated protein 2 [Thalassobacillus sp. CUG 92003]|uniref:flagellar hook-associated protein 2 n=1 Tax=Thalassobacillus sp. CUG 92003 TaxID=2736641 RepID=UPI002105F300|nr:flagellar hook-associated protein 2 [Thalassobacillus sp. CUG 92003]
MMNNSMRIGGLVSGMDIDKIVSDLMKAEKMPLKKMEQDIATQEFKRDDYREMNTLLFDLDSAAADMRLSENYKSKSASSSQSDAITATASSSSEAGSYNISVDQLATAAVNASQASLSADATDKIDPDAKLSDEIGKFANSDFTSGESFELTTHDANGEAVSKTFTVNSDQSLNDLLDDISSSDLGVRAFYDQTADKVVMEKKQTGNFNEGGSEIQFDGGAGSFLTNALQMDPAQEQGGTNAKLTYNNVMEVETHNNNYEINGITFDFQETTESSATINVRNNTEDSIQNIKDFVNKYNETIEKMDGKLNEEKFRDYKPLTEEQRSEMSEKEIELWEEKSQSGMLRGDSILSGAINSMRQDWYAEVDNDSAYSRMSEIGITTSSNYQDGGKLEIDETKLRNAMQEDPDSVYKLFSNSEEGSQQGILNRLNGSIDNAMSSIETRAGKGTQTLEQYSIGRDLKDLTERKADFERRLVDIEDRYWREFTEMERVVQKANQQSSMITQKFGGGGGMM